MRQRLFIFLLMAFIAMTGMAQTEKKKQMVPKSLMTEHSHKPFMSKPVNISRHASLPKKASRKSPKKVRLSDMSWPLKCLSINSQYYYDDDAGLQVAPIPYKSFPTTINMVDDNHISFIGLVEEGNVEVTVEVNLEDGSFSIPDGTLIATTDYGNVCIYNAFGTGDIKGYITDGGIYLETLWYDCLVDGEYAGYTWSSSYYLRSETFVEINGVMTFKNSNFSSPADVCIFQEDSKVYVFNFLGIGPTLTIDMKEHNVFEIQSQLIVESEDGEFYTYSLDESGTAVLTSAIITGTGEGNVLTFDSYWTLYSSSNLWYGATSETTITRTDGIDFVFPVIADEPAVPAQPTMVMINDYNPDNGFGSVLFDIPTTDEEGNLIKESKLYYILYSDIDGEVSTITFTPDPYNNLTENLTEIPFSFIDDYDFDIYNNHKRVWFNFDYSGYDRIGVQSVYYGGDERHVSDISWMYVSEPEPEPDPELIVLPEGAEPSEWSLTSYNMELDESIGVETYTEAESWHINVAFYEGNVYIQGLSKNVLNSWVVGTLDNGVITIPKTYLGTYSVSAVDLGGYCRETTFSYDEENNLITGGYTVEFYYEDNTLLSNSYKYVVMKPLEIGHGIPATPTVTNTKLLSTSYPYVELDVPTQSTDGNDLSTKNLWYRLIIIYNNGTHSEYNCSTWDYAYLSEDMVWVPYDYDDEYDIYIGGKKFYVYGDDLDSWKYIAVQSKISDNEGETYYSEFGIYDVDNGANISLTTEMTGGEFEEVYWSTFYNSALTYVANENTTVYVARLSADNSELQLTEVPDKIIAPGQAVVLKSSSADDFQLSVTFDENEYDYSGNALSGVDEATDVPTDQGTIYALSIKDDQLAFRQFTGSQLAAHKAYLAIDTESGAAPIRVIFNECTTGISDIFTTAKTTNGYYTLDGRHFNGVPTSRGIYIVNGEKVVIRN